MATTTRLALPRLLDADAATALGPGLRGIVDILDNAAIDQAGTLAARPAASAVKTGTYYYTTDTKTVFRSDGTNWIYVGCSAPYARVLRALGGGQSIPNSTETALTFNSEDYDTDAQHDNATNNSRLTCVIPGTYLVQARTVFTANATGQRELRLKRNGSVSYFDLDVAKGDASVPTFLRAQAIMQFSVGGYVEATVTQNSGGALSVGSYSDSVLEWMLIGP